MEYIYMEKRKARMSLWYWNRIGVLTMDSWLLICTNIEYMCKCVYMFMWISY